MAKLGVGIVGVLISLMVMLVVGILVVQALVSSQETSKTLTLSPSATRTTNATWSLTTQIQLPSGDLAVKLNVVVTAINDTVSPTITLTITGTDADGEAQNEAVPLTGVGTFTTTKSFQTVNTNGLVLSGVNTGDSVTLSVTQSTWMASANVVWATLKSNIWVAFTLLIIIPIIIGAVAILGYLRFGGG